ncbi:UDP-N-acetylenolpyruvoylglucosamine reductase [Halorhodospira halochloris]|uniref:UDP-N-acetylenolpyruvoylglucosamine reductase n=1 Tax=Halorhodospira halochloris TaxID=1052 RepID=A0A110B2C9_HALHR|nr:UDP-N-acetylmuramate dehydrogenase [Halorhodospira halochloris]MBK1651646.1 UDP-N-acetylenolpyruvoylglucosamine reductase [Halorhodospira halochloris]BAU58510.1 UDP-N-acetylenolpyruvoylglucosamine reductase [Halorhodospira halochloris]
MSAVMDRGRIRPGEMRYQEPMSRYTTWRVGGPAQRLYCPRDGADLARFVATLPADEQLFWFGLGSNMLVRDGGIEGTVVLTHGGLNGLSIEDQMVRAEVGVPCARLGRIVQRRGLTGLEFMVGIPGTVGGALAMNAGAVGDETWAAIDRVETIDKQGVVRVRRKDSFDIGYRRVAGCEGEFFVAATWRLSSGDPELLASRIKEIMRRRKLTQPLGEPTAGSVFRNPPGDSAGRLIEAAGCKGASVGRARVSERHANFIVNEGGKAADIEALMAWVRDKVASEFGVYLEPEVHVVGEAT